MVDTIKKIKDL